MTGKHGWRRRTCAVATGVSTLLLCTSGAAQATPLTATSKTAGAGRAAVTACGSLSAIVLGWAVTAGKITGVTLSSIPSTCIGATLSLTLSQSGADVGHATGIAIAATTLALVPTATPNATAPTEVRMAVSGP